MTKESEERAWDGWICHPCAVKLEYEYPAGHVSSAVFATCPHCGRKADLVPETDYIRKGRGNGKKEADRP